MSKVYLLVILSLLGLLAFTGATTTEAPDAPEAAGGDDKEEGSEEEYGGKDKEEGSEGSEAEDDEDSPDSPDSPDDSEDDERAEEKRSVNYELKEREGTIESKGGRDKLQFDFDIKEEGAKIKLSYYSKADGESVGFRFQTKLFNVVEYVDANSDNTPQDDEIVQTFSLAGDKWAPMETAKEVSKTTETKTFTFTASTADDVFSVTTHYSNAPTTNAEGVELRPSGVKFDINVDDFPYQGVDSKLALQARFRTKMKMREEGDKHRIATGEGNEAESARFTWEPTVTCDGAEVAVVASAIDTTVNDDEEKEEDEEQDARVFFTFDTTTKCKNLFWDPTVGASFANNDLGAAGTTSPSVFVFFVGMLLAFVARV